MRKAVMTAVAVAGLLTTPAAASALPLHESTPSSGWTISATEDPAVITADATVFGNPVNGPFHQTLTPSGEPGSSPGCQTGTPVTGIATLGGSRNRLVLIETGFSCADGGAFVTDMTWTIDGAASTGRYHGATGSGRSTFGFDPVPSWEAQGTYTLRGTGGGDDGVKPRPPSRPPVKSP